MRTVLLKPFRDLRRMRARALAVAAMVAVGLGVSAGLATSRQSLSNTRDTLYDELGLGDLRVLTTPADPSEIPPLGNVPGVADAAVRLVAPGALELEDGRPLNALVVYTDAGSPPAVNRLKILGGSPLDPAVEDGVVIERSLAEVHGYAVGDRITLNPYTAPREVRVLGIAVSPECLIATADATVFFPMKGSLGVVFAPMALVEEVFGTPLANEFSFRFLPGVGRAEAEERVLERLAPLGIEAVTRREDEFAYRFLEESLKGFSAFVPTLAFVFGLVVFLVTFITATRLVTEQRNEIGALRALGYRRREILLSYAVLAFVLCTLGGLAGAVLAHGVNVLFASRYASALGLPQLAPVTDVAGLLLGWAGTSALVLLAFSVPLLRLLDLPPQRILRQERKKAFVGLPKLPAAAGRLLSRLLFRRMPARFGARNLFRRFGLTVATVLSVALPVALGGAMLVVLHSVDTYKEELFRRERWDLLVQFRYPLVRERAEEILAAAGAERPASGVSGFAQVRVGGLSLNQQILGFPAERYPRELNLVAGRMFRGDAEEGIILNRNWLGEDRERLKVGDLAEVRTGERTVRLEVVGLMNDMTVGQAYLPVATAQGILGMQGTFNGAMVRVKGGAQRAVEKLFGYEEVARVYSLDEIRAGMQEYMNQMRGVLHASVAVSIAIAALFLLGSVLLAILEREAEFAILRAMGYGRLRITGIVMTELGLKTICAVGVSLPLIVALALFINHEQGKIYFPIPTALRAREFLLVSSLALLFIPLAGLPGLRHVFRMDVASALRRRAMG